MPGIKSRSTTGKTGLARKGRKMSVYRDNGKEKGNYYGIMAYR